MAFKKPVREYKVKDDNLRKEVQKIVMHQAGCEVDWNDAYDNKHSECNNGRCGCGEVAKEIICKFIQPLIDKVGPEPYSITEETLPNGNRSWTCHK